MFGWSLSGDFFTLTFLVASVAKVVNGEKLLTTGKEELPDGHKDWTADVHVDEYNQLDQCMRQPGYPEIYHHAIMFQLLPDQMNSGTGLIICYSGQLDRRNHDKGIVADILHRVNNIRGNALGDLCENARKDLTGQCDGKTSLAEKEQCEHFVEYPWHAIQLVEDPDGKNIIVHLSTTDQSFSISREKFNKYTGRLFLKLANWEELRSNFSRHIGPGPWPSDFCVENDCAQYRFYKDNAVYGHLLRHHMGIWSIGLDMLPKDPMATELDFYVIRSKCSEMAVSVLHPSESSVTKLPNPALKRNIVQNVSVERMIFENSTLVLQGQVEESADIMQFKLSSDAPVPALECGSQDPSESKVISLELNFDFNTRETKMVAIEHGSNDAQENITATGENQLHRGQNFLIEVVSHDQNVEVSVNCGPNFTFHLNKPLPFNRPLNFTVNGAKIYSMQNLRIDSSSDYWQLNGGHRIRYGYGVLVGGKMKKDWKKIKFTFIQPNKKPLLSLLAENNKNSVELKWAPNDTMCNHADGIIATGIIDKQCNCFELYFELRMESIAILLNGQSLAKMLGIEKVSFNMTNPVEILSVKMDADVDSKLELNETTWTVVMPGTQGRVFQLNGIIENGDTIKITGKFFAKATFLKISLFYFEDYDAVIKKANKCLEDVSDIICLIVLEIRIDLSKNIITIRRQKVGELIKEWKDENEYDTTQFVPGQNFELKINAIRVDEKEKGKTVQKPKFLIDGIKGMEPITREDKAPTTMIEVSLDDGVLFDKPKIEK